MKNGGTSATTLAAAVNLKGAVSTISMTEGAVAERVLSCGAALTLAEKNAFGDRVAGETGEDIFALLDHMRATVEAGERVALVAGRSALGRVRHELYAMAKARLSGVVHVLDDYAAGGGCPTDDVRTLADLGWGLLFASTPQDSRDLSLIARRASEDSGTPFFVVHGGLQLGAPPAAIDRSLYDAFIGAPRTRLFKSSDPAHPRHATESDEAFAERVPFAVGSAMRQFEALTGIHHDVLVRTPASDAHVVLVGFGELADSLLHAAPRLREKGHDVGAVKLIVVRPFPGARLVKTLARTLAIGVLERVGEPLAASGPLARELKSVFADALTWAPGYPGIGRIPRILHGIVRRRYVELDAVDSLVRTMLADERRLPPQSGGTHQLPPQSGGTHVGRSFILEGTDVDSLAPAGAARSDVDR